VYWTTMMTGSRRRGTGKDRCKTMTLVRKELKLMGRAVSPRHRKTAGLLAPYAEKLVAIHLYHVVYYRFCTLEPRTIVVTVSSQPTVRSAVPSRHGTKG
jgi:hypothetical protein